MRAILTLMIILAGLCSALAQGSVIFVNGFAVFPTVADRRVYGPDCAPLVGTNYVAGLFYLPGADQDFSGSTAGTQAGPLATFRPPTTALPGVWLNPITAGNPRVLEGVVPGSTATLQVRVWDITQFSSWDAALHGDGFHLASAPFNYTVPYTGEPIDYYMDNLRAFGPASCPEPSVPALLGLGALAWLWLRQKGQGRGRPFR